MTHAAALIHLDLPAEPGSLAVLRTAAAAAGVSLRGDLPVATLDDLRLAVDELAAVVVQGAPVGARLDVSIQLQDGALVVLGRRTSTAPHDGAGLSDVSMMLLDSVCRRYEVGPRGTFAAEFDLAG